MTRINVGVSPRELPRQLLLAEYREITRIPNAVKSGRANLATPRPKKFKLGTGHVCFFYDKLAYLHDRYRSLLAECLRRDYAVQDKNSAWYDLPANLYNPYTPSDEDRAIVLQRIADRGFHLLP